MSAYTFPLIVTVSALVRVLTNLEQKAICRVTKQWNDFFSVPSLGPHVRLCSFVKGFKMHTENSQGLEAGSWLSYGCLCPPIYENALPARFLFFWPFPCWTLKVFMQAAPTKPGCLLERKGTCPCFHAQLMNAPTYQSALTLSLAKPQEEAGKLLAFLGPYRMLQREQTVTDVTIT